ncbi:MAG: hypothetical protein VB081_12625 [Christensenella sp.]|uniref:hypothetical protein n=1 Tax=Christensenella sp. TaxID=1935934 RepID=UPI002B20896D|nr:hypothetical protein [Christensenella sp.]MEA5004324.1 hypothetical protein [Christensenella sp.]
MDTKQLTEKVIVIGEEVKGHEQQIRTLFEQQKEIKDLTKATNSLAISVEKLADKVLNVDERLDCIEKGEKQKHFELWKVLVPGVVGALIMYAVNYMLK